VIYTLKPFKGRRLRTRRVDEEAHANYVAQRARETDSWQVDVDHGGGVANSYGFPANTECVLALSDPFGIVTLWTGRTRANGVTLRSAAEACFQGSGDLFDLRIKSPERRQLVFSKLMEKHRQEVPAMVVIAVAASQGSSPTQQGGG